MIPAASPLREQLLYRALGAAMLSDFHFRDLQPVPVAPSADAVTMRIERAEEPAVPEGELVHSTPDSDAGPRLELWESDRVLTWRVRGVGTFALRADGRHVHYWLEDNAEHGDAEIMLSGPIMGTAAQLRGEILLHGAALIANDVAIAISAPHGFGKSTLITSFARAGYPMLAEDIVHIREDGTGLEVAPYVPRIKLLDESVERFGEDPAEYGRVLSWHPKRTIRPGGAWGVIAEAPVPLRAVYFLEPYVKHSRDVEIEEIGDVEAVMRLHGSMYHSHSMRGRRTVASLDAATRVASVVPVRIVRYVRDFDVLDDLRAAILQDAERNL